MKKIRLAAIATLVLVFDFCAAAHSQTQAQQAFPSRAIQLVVGLAPGSVQDAAARLIARRAGQLLGAQVIVENKSGAGTMIASSYVAKSRPDGYTLLQNGVALSVNPSLYK